MAGKAEYKNQWQKENCDRVNLTMPKGRKVEVQAHAEAHSESVNGFINRAILEAMGREKGAHGDLLQDVQTLSRAYYGQLVKLLSDADEMDAEAKAELFHVLGEEEQRGQNTINELLSI